MKLTIHDPEGIYPSAPDYVHALEVEGSRRILFVSGTMGLDAAGAAPATLDEQLERVWVNIRRILASAGMSVDNIVRQTSYLTDASFADANAKARVAALHGRLIPTTAIVVQTLVSSWLIEIEIIAAA